MIIFENLLIVPMELDEPSQIFAVDKKTGKIVWQVDRPVDRATYATPCLFQNGARTELICPSNAQGITSLDPKTGAILWSTHTALPERVVSSPVLTQNLVLTQCGSGGSGKLLMGVALPGTTSNETIKPVLSMKKNVPYVVTPIAHDGLLYLWCDGGVVKCVELTSGEDVWTERVGGNFNGSPVLAGEKLYCQSENGELVCLQAGREFKVLGRTDLGEGSLATPAIARGKMIMRTERQLIAVNAEK